MRHTRNQIEMEIVIPIYQKLKKIIFDLSSREVSIGVWVVEDELTATY